MIQSLNTYASLLMLAFLGHGAPTAQRASPLEGAWKLVESSLGNSDTVSVNRSPQPGLVLFTRRHYSLMYVEGTAPRKPFVDPFGATDAEKLVAFDTFAGHTGTFAVNDSVVEMTIVVSKNPSLASPDMRSSFARFVYRISGDSLVLRRQAPRGAFTMKLVRAD